MEEWKALSQPRRTGRFDCAHFPSSPSPIAAPGRHLPAPPGAPAGLRGAGAPRGSSALCAGSAALARPRTGSASPLGAVPGKLRQRSLPPSHRRAGLWQRSLKGAAPVRAGLSAPHARCPRTAAAPAAPRPTASSLGGEQRLACRSEEQEKVRGEEVRGRKRGGGEGVEGGRKKKKKKTTSLKKKKELPL